MLSLAAYADRLSVRPGETIQFHVANKTGANVEARLVRVVSADPNPAAGGVRTVAMPNAGLRVVAAPKAQPIKRGSFAAVPWPSSLAVPQSLSFVATIFPTGPHNEEQTLFSFRDLMKGGLGLGIDRKNRLVAWLGVEQESEGRKVCAWRTIETPTPLALHRWQRVWVTFDRSNGQLCLGVQPLGPAPGQVRQTQAKENRASPFAGLVIAVGASTDDSEGAHHWAPFNGKIERPSLYDRAVSADEVARAARGERAAGLVAAWDFSEEMQTSRIVDCGPNSLHGTLRNIPTRGMRGSNWTGREQCYRHALEQYGAIHFHDDDIDDMRWPVTHEYTVPVGLKSGAYALMLDAGAEQENVPFFVVPPKGKATAKLAVLVSTFTYTVYGNHARPEWASDPNWRNAWIQQSNEWSAYPHNPAAHPEYGLSTYNYHTDGSGIAIASWHRPMLNVRIGYITYPYPDIRASGLRHYPADSHLLAWLEAKGHDYDLITDWELHHEGAELLKRYTCVMTGSHPEYHTGEMLDALEGYRDSGGRFMYMGGNGFYWKIALSPEKPGVIEIRRAEGGIRAWAAEPGEYYNQFDGEYGGLWRRNGRPPQALVGVGFTAQGNFVGSYYRVAPDARSSPRTAWIFDGVKDDVIGNYGFSGHGAAGFELDRADKRLGTPSHAVVVAQSQNHPPEAPWVLVPEEQLTHITTLPGQSHKQLIRADMTFFETPHNGAVFSTGSITFCGSLPYNNFDNSVSKIIENVLQRFLDPKTDFALS